MIVRRIALLSAVLGLVIAPSAALSFGTIQGYIFGNGPFNSEHEMITRAALSCAVPDKVANCFEPRSLDNLAGKPGTFGAVGAPDNYSTLGGGPDYWHCDGADAFAGTLPNYPVSTAAAQAKLLDCRTYVALEMGNGTKGTAYSSRGTRDGAVGGARFLLNTKGEVDVSDLSGSSCTFNLSSGRAKCNELESFGRALHAIQDFYSHSNWADSGNPDAPVSLTNPPGLGKTTPAPFWDLSTQAAEVPDGLGSGCYPTSKCANRVTHDEGLNKDKVIIDWRRGMDAAISCSGVCTRRGLVGTNEESAVRDAIADTRRQWAWLQGAIVAREGAVRGARIICAISRDDINNVCNQAAGSRQAAPSVSSPSTKRVTKRVLMPAAPAAAVGPRRTCAPIGISGQIRVVGITATGLSCSAAAGLIRALPGAWRASSSVAVPGKAYTSALTSGPFAGMRMTVRGFRAAGASSRGVIVLTAPGRRVEFSLACMSSSRGGDSTCGF